MTQEVETVEFESDGAVCRGLSIPPRSATWQRGGRAPCVVMAHGFGGTIDAGLEPFADRFADAGIHAFLFDYRHFGTSDGTPRQLLSIRRELDDWMAAVAHARTLPGVDPKRILLFGTSFSGGHVVEVAVADGQVVGVVSQCPMMDGLLALRNLTAYAGIGPLLRVTAAGIRDVLQRKAGRPPVMLPIVGPPGSIAAMTTPDAEPGFQAIAPPGFVNEICAGIALTVATYRPGRKADHLPCPILIQICEHDSVAPAEAAEAAARRAGARAVVRRYPVGHFDVYLGEPFERSVSDQIEFFRDVLAD